MNATHPDSGPGRRNRRTALFLAVLAAAFLIGFVLKIWLK